MLSRVLFVGSILLLAAAGWLMRRARRRERPVGPVPWLLAVFAVACLVFLGAHAFVTVGR